MVGVIIVGHGGFGKGMHSALRLLNGECDSLVSLDFQEGTSFEDLCEQMYAEIDKFNKNNVIILTDLPGGSPFKAAAMATFKYPNVRALTGINFPVLLEIVLSKDYEEGMDALIDKAVENAKDALRKVVLEV